MIIECGFVGEPGEYDYQILCWILTKHIVMYCIFIDCTARNHISMLCIGACVVRSLFARICRIWTSGYVCAASWHNHREQLIVRRTIVSALCQNMNRAAPKTSARPFTKPVSVLTKTRLARSIPVLRRRQGRPALRVA